MAELTTTTVAVSPLLMSSFLLYRKSAKFPAHSCHDYCGGMNSSSATMTTTRGITKLKRRIIRYVLLCQLFCTCPLLYQLETRRRGNVKLSRRTRLVVVGVVAAVEQSAIIKSQRKKGPRKLVAQNRTLHPMCNFKIISIAFGRQVDIILQGVDKGSFGGRGFSILKKLRSYHYDSYLLVIEMIIHFQRFGPIPIAKLMLVFLTEDDDDDDEGQVRVKILEILSIGSLNTHSLTYSPTHTDTLFFPVF